MSGPISESNKAMPNASCSNTDARRWVIDAEDREQLRLGVALPIARQSLSRKIGVPVGTLHNIRRARLKGLKTWVYEKIRAYIMAELRAEIKRLSDELEMAARFSSRPTGDEIEQAKNALAEARKLVSRGEK